MLTMCSFHFIRVGELKKEVLLIGLFLFNCAGQIRPPKVLRGNVANADSLIEVIDSMDDFKETKFSTWLMDSLEKRMDLTNLQMANLSGKSRFTKAIWFDGERIRRGRNGSKVDVFNDSLFQNTSLILYHSEKDLSAITEKYVYQKMNSDLTRIFAIDSTKLEGYKFKNNGHLNQFISSFEDSYFKSPRKKGNTTYYASVNTGDDANDPCDGGWSDACATIGATLNDLSAGDSLTTVGDSFGENVAPSSSGTSGNYIVWADSAVHANAGSWDLSTVDTLNVWNTVVDGTSQALTMSGDDFWRVVGIHFKSGSGNTVSMTNGSDDNHFNHNMISEHADGGGTSITLTSTSANDTISVNLIAEASGVNRLFTYSASGTGNYFTHNTIRGVGTTETVQLIGTAGITFKDNAIENTSTTNGDQAIDVDDVASVTDLDYNIYHAAAPDGNWFQFNGGTGSTIAAWQDSVDNYDGDSANEVDQDPAFLNEATTVIINDSSPAANSGQDLDGFDDRGYWNVEAAAPAGGRNILQIIFNYRNYLPICARVE